MEHSRLPYVVTVPVFQVPDSYTHAYKQTGAQGAAVSSPNDALCYLPPAPVPLATHFAASLPSAAVPLVLLASACPSASASASACLIPHAAAASRSPAAVPLVILASASAARLPAFAAPAHVGADTATDRPTAGPTAHESLHGASAASPAPKREPVMCPRWSSSGAVRKSSS